MGIELAPHITLPASFWQLQAFLVTVQGAFSDLLRLSASLATSSHAPLLNPDVWFVSEAACVVRHQDLRTSACSSSGQGELQGPVVGCFARTSFVESRSKVPQNTSLCWRTRLCALVAKPMDSSHGRRRWLQRRTTSRGRTRHSENNSEGPLYYRSDLTK